jgi:hypothetical protein
MQFNVAQLLKEPTGSIRRYELVEDITELDPELVVMGPLVGDVQLLRINSGVLVEAGLSTAVRLTCNRCLAPIATPVRFTLEESFRPLTEVATGRYLPPDEYEGAEEDLEDEAGWRCRCIQAAFGAGRVSARTWLLIAKRLKQPGPTARARRRRVKKRLTRAGRRCSHSASGWTRKNKTKEEYKKWVRYRNEN